MAVIKEFLLQLLIMLLPYVAFNMYYRNRPLRHLRRFVTVISAVCLAMSMLLVTPLSEGVYIDGRYVIMFFGLVFGGMQTGLFLLAEFTVLRFLLGGPILLAGLAIVAVTFPLSVALSRIYHRAKRKSLVTVLTGILCCVIPAFLLYLFRPFAPEEAFNLPVLYFLLMNGVGSWLLTKLFAESVADHELSIRFAQTEKIEAVGQVAASLVHEVRNPLTAVKGFLKLIHESPLPREKEMQYIEISMDEITRTETILSDYLKLSKPQEGVSETIELSSHVRSVCEVMTSFANMHNVKLEIKPSDSIIRIDANADKLKQALLNFIKNSIEACSSKPGGLVSIRVSAEDGKALIAITDNGVGMTKNALERLGSIYYSTKLNGTGLGLAFSYRVIRDLGGTIRVTSELGRGSCFVIRLPLAVG